MKKPVVLLVSLGSPTTNKALELRMSEASFIRDAEVENAFFVGDGGTPPYAYAITAGAEPSGVTLEEDGKLTGTPIDQGYTEILVQVTDAVSDTFEAWFTIDVKGGIVIQATLPYACVGSAYSAILVASGGTLPYASWEVSAGALPDGLSIVENAGVWTIEGTPTGIGISAPQLVPFTLKVTDDMGNFAEAAFQMAVWDAISLTGDLEIYVWQNTGFQKRYIPSWGVTSGAMSLIRLPRHSFRIDVLVSPPVGGLPNGLTLDPLQGIISGYPTTVTPNGTANLFDIVAMDEFGGEASLSQVFRVQETATPFVMTPIIFGDDTSTSFDFELPFSRDAWLAVIEIASGEEMECQILRTYTSGNLEVTVIFAIAPPEDSVKLVGVGL